MTRSARELLAKIESRRVISLVGGGGKTTLMFRLARELTRQGKRVITTTTTKIAHDEARQAGVLIVAESTGDQLVGHLNQALHTHGQVSLAQERLSGQGKLLGIDMKMVETVLAARICDHLIVEADGAARRPLKAPAAHEPLLPDSTDLLLAVVGLDGVGKSLTPEWVHRPEEVGRLSGLAPGETIGAEDVARVIAHDQGLMKNLPPGAESWVFLNQADLPGAEITGIKIAEILLDEMPRHPRQLIIGAAAREHWIYKAYLLGGREKRKKAEEYE
jgi:probable selenium-dependent hydroxylase accessory protein YqeC